MERWAKAQNKRNESAITGKAATAEPAGGSREGSGTGAADAAFAVLLERRDRASLVEKQSQVFQMHMKKDSAPVSFSNVQNILLYILLTAFWSINHFLVIAMTIYILCNSPSYVGWSVFSLSHSFIFNIDLCEWIFSN